jgi:hypothetical protein
VLPNPAMTANIPRWTFNRIFFVLAIEFTLLSIVNVPSIFSFDNWAFGDRGAELTIQYLARAGYSPGVDFFYHYGLLPILAGKLWFGALGITPSTCFAAMFVCELFIVRGMARFAVALQLSPIGIAFLLAAFPLAIMQPSYPTLAHSIEALLLCNALAEQAAGKHSRALALVSAAVFAKPSLAYVFGLLLLIVITWKSRQDKGSLSKEFLSLIFPAAATASVLAITLATIYGPRALLRTVTPIRGAMIYRLLNFGVGSVPRFLHPSGVGIHFYLGTAAGLWGLGSLWLIACALVSIPSSWNRSGVQAAKEVIVTCALLHLAFIFLAFGNAFSWAYYSYILVMGIAATSVWQYFPRYVVGALAILAVTSQESRWVSAFRQWRTTAPSQDTAGLWASQDERAEWQDVMHAVAQHSNSRTGCENPEMLSYEGGVQLIVPGFAKPVTAYFLHGLPPDQGSQAKAAQLANASLTIVPEVVQVAENPPIDRTLLTNLQPIFKGRFFSVYRRPGCGSN